MVQPTKTNRIERSYCNLAYSSFACFRIGISASASFQIPRKSWYAVRALAFSPPATSALPNPRCASDPIGEFCTIPG